MAPLMDPARWPPVSSRTAPREHLVTDTLTTQLGSSPGANKADLASAAPEIVKALIARANRTLFFSRALKLVNGGLGNLPQGLTIVAENPVYVQGNYNAIGRRRD